MWRYPKFLILLLASSLIVLSGAALTPILPELIQQLQLDRGLAGSLVSVHFLSFALGLPFLGILADRVGKPRMLIVSLLSYSGLGMMGAVLPTFQVLLGNRCLLGVACAGIVAPCLGLLTSMYEAQQRTQAIAYVSGTMTLANIVYPFLAGGIGDIHWQLAFGLYGLGLPLAAAVFLIYAPRKSDRSLSLRPHYPLQGTGGGIALSDILSSRLIFRQPMVLRLLIILMTVMGLVYGMGIYLPLYLKTQFVSEPGLNGQVLSLMAIGSAVGAVICLPQLTKRFDILGIIVTGLGMMAVLLISLPTLGTLVWIAGTVLILGMGIGIVVPGLYNALANVTPAELQASVLATGTGVGLLGQFMSPLVLGLILTLSSLSGVFNTQACLALASGMVLLWPLPSRPSHSSEDQDK